MNAHSSHQLILRPPVAKAFLENNQIPLVSLQFRPWKILDLTSLWVISLPA
jgi:hypothetical protein